MDRLHSTSGARGTGLVGGLVFACFALTPAGAGAQQRFEQPRVDSVRVDWCLTWGAECGQPAADRFCRDRGFPAAVAFEIARAVGPTRVLGTGQRCNDARCDGFLFIQCAVRQLPNLTPMRPVPQKREEPGSVRASTGRPTLKRADLKFASLIAMTAMPSGAELYYWAGDIQTAMDFAAHGRGQRFNWNVKKVQGAQGAIWQVSRYPFPPYRAGDPELLEPPGVVASGRGSQSEGSFDVDFAPLPKPSLGPHSLKVPRPVPWYVRVLPVSAGDPPAIVGQPSNLVRVFDNEMPPPPEPAKLPPTTDILSANISLLRVEYRGFWSEMRWPPGCSTSPPPEKSIFEEAWDALTDAWGAVSEGYARAKSLALDLASTLTGGVIPRTVLDIALTAALASAGVPPNIPNLDQLMNEGSDYLAAAVAEQVVGPAADDVINGLAKQYNVDPNLGPDQLKQAITAKVRASSKQALLDGAAAARRPRSGHYPCTGRTHPPRITLTVRSDDTQGNRATRVSVQTEPDVFKGTSAGVIIEPGETLTIPISLAPNIPEKFQTQLPNRDSAENALYWRNEIYGGKPARIRIESSTGMRCFGYDESQLSCGIELSRKRYTSSARTLNNDFTDLQPTWK